MSRPVLNTRKGVKEFVRTINADLSLDIFHWHGEQATDLGIALVESPVYGVVDWAHMTNEIRRAVLARSARRLEGR